MKNTALFIVTIFVAFSCYAGDLSIAQLAKVANSSSISAVSSIASNNGYKLAYKKTGAKGYEGYDVTDIAWAYNARFIESCNMWQYQGSYSVIKLLFNNKTHMPETILYEFTDSSYFQTLKREIVKYGYELFQENPNAKPDAIEYCFFNEKIHMFAIFVEYCGDKSYQIHFFRN